MPTKVKHRSKNPGKAMRRPKKNGKQAGQTNGSPSSNQVTASLASNQTKGDGSPALRPGDVLALQATMGNAAVGRLVSAQRARGQRSEGSKSTNGAGKQGVQTSMSMRSLNGNGLIQRAPAGGGLVVEKTHLRKPNKAGTAPRKLPSIFNQVGKAVKKNTVITLLDTEVQDGKNVTWQKAKHPVTDKVGFVRMSKVMATGPEAPSSIKMPSGPTGVEKAEKLAKILTGIVSDGSKVGSSIGTMLSANTKTTKDLAQVMLTKPEFANKWFQFGDTGTKTEAEALVLKDLPKFNDVLNKEWQLGFATGGYATGALGDVGSGIGGLLGMIKGFQKFSKSKGKLSDTIDYAVAETTGAATITSSGAGALSKISGLVSGFTKNEGVKSVFKSLQGIFGFVGNGIKTVKGSVQTVVKIVKAIQGGVKKRGKSFKAKLQTFIEATADIAGSALGTVKSAIMTVAGVLKTVKSLPLVSSILGIVGSVIDLVSGALSLITTIYDTVKLILKIKKEKQMVEDLKKGDYTDNEAQLTQKLLVMEQATMVDGETASEADLVKDEDGIPTIQQQEKTLRKYRQSGEGNRNSDYYAEDVETHLADQNLIGTVHKRIKKAYYKIPGLVVDGLASAISIIGGLVSIGADIAAVASAPTGIGTAAAIATKTIASTVASVLSGSLKIGKALFTLGRMGARKIKQFARDKDWAATNQDKTTEKKVEKRKNTVRSMMMAIYDLDPDFSDFKESAERAQLRIEATGVDTMTLYEKNGEPLEQAKILMKALGDTG